MASETPVILEVALNGQTRRERNPHVPLSRQEIIDEGLRCIDAGASILHNHNENLAVTAEEAASEYGACFRPWLERNPDVLCLPTVGNGDSIEEKLRHLELLASAGVLRLGFIDPGTLLLGWMGPDGKPAKDSYVYINTFGDMEHAIEQCTRLRLGLHLAIFEPGFLRNVFSYYKLGMIPPGSFVKFYFGGDGGYFSFGEGVSFGLPPTEKALGAYLEMLELAGWNLPWFVAVVGGDLFDTPIARAALERGGHLRVGHEDFWGKRTPSNLELVQEAVALAKEVGRPVATPAQTVEILGLPPRS
jgi:uncharacterized protein (DUF849 family)